MKTTSILSVLSILATSTLAYDSYSSFSARNADGEEELDFYTRDIDDDFYDFAVRSTSSYERDGNLALDARDVDEDWYTLSARAALWDEDNLLDNGVYARSFLGQLASEAKGRIKKETPEQLLERQRAYQEKSDQKKIDKHKTEDEKRIERENKAQGSR